MKGTVAVMALAIMPAVTFAQQDTTASGQSSADRNRNQQNQPTLDSQDSTRRAGRRGAQRRTSAEATGSIDRANANETGSAGARGSYGLSFEQVIQLQEALESAGCRPGTIDGVVGPRTRSAMACARKKNGVTGNDRNGLYQSLGLDFSTEGQAGMRGTAGENQGRVRPPADSAADPSGMGARPAREAQQGQGMHDSTTSTNRPRSDSTASSDSSMNRGSRPDSTSRSPR